MNTNLKILFTAFVLGVVFTVMLHVIESRPKLISFDVSHFKQLE
jgi:hypothetical protein